MRTPLRNLLFIVLIVCSLSSCIPVNRYVYRANPINLPGLTEQGQSRVTASVAGNAQGDGLTGLGGYDLQGAIAVSNRITLLGGYSNRSGSEQGQNRYPYLFNLGTPDTNNQANLHYRNNTWELGAAYMVKFGRHVYFSASAGGGAGNYHIDDHGAVHDSLYRNYLDARQGQWFIQPAMYFKVHQVEMGVGFKVSGTHYFNVNTNYTDDQQVNFTLNDLHGKDMTMFQPFLLLRIRPHLPWLQIEMQGSLNVGGASSGAPAYNYYYFNGGLGLSVDLVRLIRGRDFD